MFELGTSKTGTNYFVVGDSDDHDEEENGRREPLLADPQQYTEHPIDDDFDSSQANELFSAVTSSKNEESSSGSLSYSSNSFCCHVMVALMFYAVLLWVAWQASWTVVGIFFAAATCHAMRFYPQFHGEIQQMQLRHWQQVHDQQEERDLALERQYNSLAHYLTSRENAPSIVLMRAEQKILFGLALFQILYFLFLLLVA